MSHPRWHKPSNKEGDTHWGVLQADRFVAAQCGAVFQPMEDLFTPRASLEVAVAKRCMTCSPSPGSERNQDATRVEDVMTTLVRPRVKTTRRRGS
jgi:hypothetical protein